MVQTKQEAQQACTGIQDKTEFSRVQTALGLMFFSQHCYTEAANCFLQAKALSPVSVIELFLHGITLDRLSNCVYPDRADQPPIALLERCQHFGDFRQFLMDQLSDEHWRSLAPEGQHTVTF